MRTLKNVTKADAAPKSDRAGNLTYIKRLEACPPLAWNNDAVCFVNVYLFSLQKPARCAAFVLRAERDLQDGAHVARRAEQKKSFATRTGQLMTKSRTGEASPAKPYCRPLGRLTSTWVEK